MSPEVYLPKQSSFLFQRVSVALVFSVLTGLIGAVALSFEHPSLMWVPPALGVLALLQACIAALVAVKKERYEVFERHIAAHRGGIFSDQTTELEFANVTHIKQRLPWIRYRFFKVGDVIVESAGSSSSHVVFRSVREPDRIYEMLQEKLRSNGYSMRRTELLHEETPSTIGAVLEVVQLAFGIFFGLVMTVGLAIAELADGGGSWPKMSGTISALILAVSVLSVGWSLALIVLRYLDLRRRTYRVFDDVVVYKEGFLSQTNAVIPVENIADANTRQNLWDQVLGLYDVSISCQGSGSEIKFRRLQRGEELKRTVSSLVQAADDQRRRDADRVAQEAAPQLSTEGAPKRGRIAPVPAHEAWTAEIRPNVVRELASLIVIAPILPLLLMLAVPTWINATVRRYSIGTSSARVSRGVLNKTETDFAYDKITGVMIRRGPLDRLFKTATVQLWSIGAPIPLTLANVNESELDLPRLLRQVGILQAPIAREFPAKYGVHVWLRTSFATLVIVGLMALIVGVVAVTTELHGMVLISALLLTLPLVSYVVQQAGVARQRFTLHAEHMELRNGIFWRNEYYAAYENLKKVSVTRYPWCNQGTAQIFVAGERRVGQNDQQSAQGGASAYSLRPVFLEDVRGLGQTLDEVILGTREALDPRPPVEVNSELVAAPKVSQAVLGTLLAGLFLFPLLPVLLPWAVVATKRRTYLIEPTRVVTKQGILFKTETSVLLDRIDSIQSGQGFLGKIFSTGAATVYTAGSSTPDLSFSATADYQALYSEIRSRSRA